MGNRNVSAVGYGNFQRAMRDRSAFFAKMAASAPAEPGTSGVSTIVARNFRLVRPIPVPTGYRGSGISYEVKCIGEGHPEFFGDQSYVLKAIHGLTTTGVQGALENESLIAATLEPHPNISQYFCHFTDHIPQEYCHHIPQEYKELAFDTVHKRMKPCVWVVLEHHSETMEQFLRHLNSTVAPQNATATTTLITATPWAIVHKYSRDICAALVHLFLNHTIYFDINAEAKKITQNQKQNKEQAILVDFGSASKFPKADSSTGSTFEIEATSLTSVLVNQSHTAPEIVNGIANSKRNPDSSSILSCYKQPSFELGCILFELAMFGQHPLPGYPAAYGQSGECQVTFSLERVLQPRSIIVAVRS
ncbi:hypothetical protein Pelo_3337 [Pelomyxa schiedti]|nr:hypothetical protein Pelo_3337 [Pelomyxa schiedti]